MHPSGTARITLEAVEMALFATKQAQITARWCALSDGCFSHECFEHKRRAETRIPDPSRAGPMYRGHVVLALRRSFAAERPRDIKRIYGASKRALLAEHPLTLKRRGL